MSPETARRVASRLFRRTTMTGGTTRDTDAGLTIDPAPASASEASITPVGMASLVEEFGDYLIMRPLDVDFFDSSKDFPIKKPRELRSTLQTGYQVDRNGDVDEISHSGLSARRLTSVEDDDDFEDQVVIPPYIAQRTVVIDGQSRNLRGSILEFGPGAPDDEVTFTDPETGAERNVEMEDLNRWHARAWGEDNGT